MKPVQCETRDREWRVAEAIDSAVNAVPARNGTPARRPAVPARQKPAYGVLLAVLMGAMFWTVTVVLVWKLT